MMKNGRAWPWALGLVLALTVVGNLWVMRVAGSDPSFVIEPDYYQKAVNWDSTMAQSARNVELGWTLTARLAPAGTDGNATLTAQLRDAGGAPITGAVLTVEATHNARASEILAAELTAAEDGSYTALLPAARRGLWELRFEAARNGEQFTATVRTDTTRDPAR
jgi:nitrogen fixation protein FixH